MSATKLLFYYTGFILLGLTILSIYQGMFLTFLISLGVMLFMATGYALAILAIQETDG